MDELEPGEVFFIIEDNIKHEQELIEANRYAIMAAIASIFDGRDMKLFDNNNADGYEVVDENDYQEEKQMLLQKYKSGGDS